MDRRLFLKRGIAGGALLTLFGGGVLGFRRGEYANVGARELRVLDEPTFWILAAVASRTTPATGELAATIAHSVDIALRTSPPRAQRDFVQVLYLLENALAGLVFHGSTKVFTKLSATDQDAALYAWRDSSVGLLRGAYHSLRRLTLGAYYSNAERAAEVGYGGPLWKKPEPPKITDTGALSPAFVVVPPTAEASDPAQPDPAQPDTAQPDTAQPDPAQPDTAQPDTAQPDTAQPDTAQPDTAQPDTAQPDAASLDAPGGVPDGAAKASDGPEGADAKGAP